ncbi:TPA: McrC family protein [Vibrio parahaemolyticus]|uniref:McrC family protein n=1 Tax=Vibrio parahaemolyticus TaxID=670 RepID=UPI0004082FBB|nr:McrC family protein [Vibrio parahaemolyticus]KON59154.1 McrBC 5-methylcytosine restriction system component [Vibrio parahaemolyticus]KZW06807.1 restriction endonuclease [Vibrio parahaemolyticus]KZW08191.1 restriction endonuclease [Vibrio parahaemolyticus]KZW11518.1 restriction endonuclease [Vibrio parahaemolyticus]KZW20122.1 restriction endonuclease [Vibrio parahaemolyticus]
MLARKVYSTITIREFGLLLNGGDKSSIDCHSIPRNAFEWLLVNGQSNNQESVDLIKVKKHGRSIALQVINYVGVLETPCGTRIEILPKISEQEDSQSATKVLLKMLSTVHKLNMHRFENTSLQTLNRPLFEALIGFFLKEVSDVIKKGIRSQYTRVQERKPYLKGQLQTSKQLNQRPGCLNSFHISYDEFSPDRAENRLIRSALNQVMKWSKNSDNLRLGSELQFALDDIPCSKNYAFDFRQWSKERSLVHYRTVKPWCELILSYCSPVSLSGLHNGISMLFPMENLFERYVAIRLGKSLQPSLKLKTQANSCALVTHKPRSGKSQEWFRLKPDIVVNDKTSHEPLYVADTKWKRIDEKQATAKQKYGISQSDMYQMFAYGQNYLGGSGVVYLIYPAHESFNRPLPPFKFDEKLSIRVIPYELLKDECELLER